MQAGATTITDIWFHSPLTLKEIAAELGLTGVRADAENYWEWIVGTVSGMELDVTRTHTRPPADVPTRVFRYDQQPFTDEQTAALAARLSRFILGPIVCGRRVKKIGDEWVLHEVRKHREAARNGLHNPPMQRTGDGDAR